jgi:hypothetical protein
MTSQPLVPAVGPHLRYPFHLAAGTLVMLVSQDPGCVDRALDDLWEASYLGYRDEVGSAIEDGVAALLKPAAKDLGLDVEELLEQEAPEIDSLVDPDDYDS